MKQLSAGGREIEVLRREQRIGSALMEKRPSARRRFGHHIRVGSRRRRGDPQLRGVYSVRATVILDDASTRIVTHEPDGFEREGRAHARQILEQVIS